MARRVRDWQTEAESLRGALGRVEAFVQAADAAGASLPNGKTRGEREAVRRVLVLMEQAARVAAKALR